MMKKFLTSREAADYLAVTENELNELVDDKQVPAYRIGGIYTRFKVDDLESYRRKKITKHSKRHLDNLTDSIKDFFYFNDFYIFSAVTILIILYFIFR